jgi:hypothetical protein
MNLGIKAKCSRGMLSCRDCRSNGGEMDEQNSTHIGSGWPCGWDISINGNWWPVRESGGGGGGRREVHKDARTTQRIDQLIQC